MSELDLDGIERARVNGGVGATPEQTRALVRRVRELEAEARELERARRGSEFGRARELLPLLALELKATEARVRELEAELRERSRDPLCLSCMKDWCQKKGTDIGDEDEDFYVATCITCGRDME